MPTPRRWRRSGMKRQSWWLAGMLAGLIFGLPLAQAQTSADYTHGVDVSGSTATIWFKPTQTSTTWVDVHYQLNGGVPQNLRMTYNAAARRHEQLLRPVAAGNTLAYRFTYNKGGPAYDTPTFSFTVGGPGGGGGTFTFTNGVDQPSSSAVTLWLKPSQPIAFADVHYTINGAGQQNFRMALNSASGRFEKTVTALSAGQVISYWFTYSLTGATTADTGRFSFTVGGGTVATPTFTPGPGTYNAAQTVSISTATAGATIVYTVDGSTPTASSTRYTGPISVPTARTLKALATKTGMANSAVATGAYTITIVTGTVATPTLTPAPGTYNAAQTVSISTATAGATIKFTVDGSTPTAASPTYTGPISVPTTRTVKAVATKAGMNGSGVASGTYTINAVWNGLTTFNIVNQTNGKWADSQVYWAIIGRDWLTGDFVHVDLSGNLIPMRLGDNGQLVKNGQGYANYFFSLAQSSSVTIPPISSARILLSVGSPMYIRVVADGNGHIAYAGANIENPSDPNRDVIFDFGEMAILPKGHPSPGIFVNTTRVDQFGFPLKLRVQGLNGYDQTVGEPLTEGRDTLVQKFIAEVPAEFRGLAQAPYAPYRIMAPAHATFTAGKANANYLQAYIDSLWAKYRTQDLVFTLGGLGTFTGRVVGDQFRFTGGNKGGTFFINGKPSTSMALLGNGFLADPAGASDVGTQLQIQAQICAALNRHVVEQPANWHNAAAFYPAGQPANWFAKFWHDHSIDNLAYGFAYDDVGGFSPSLYTDSPTVVTFTIGW